MKDVRNLPRVATIATLAKRQETFEKVLPAIYAQVDHVFIYLDGYSKPPRFLSDFDRTTTYHAEAVGDLHCSSRFLCLQELDEPALVVVVDDDIAYPSDYVSVMAKVLQRLDARAMVGVHGRIFLPPHRSYVRDALFLPFFSSLKQPRHVHELGVGTCAFVSNLLDVDPREWDRHDMDDIVMAIESQRRGFPRLAISRPENWLTPYGNGDDESLWAKTKHDDGEQSRRMRVFLQLYANGDRTSFRSRHTRAIHGKARMPT